jgi:hypothetical protein
MITLLLQAAQTAATGRIVWADNLPMVAIAIVTVLTAVVALVKWISHAASKRSILSTDVADICERLDAIEISQEHTADEMHQVTLIISGVDGKNGLNGRMKEVESNIRANGREISEIRGELRGRFGVEDEN